MQTRHNISEPVRAYLLGTIDDAEAVQLETKYFTDPAVLQQVHAAESILIEDYLENRLSSNDKRLFEGRYLELPILKRRVEEVRRQHELSKSSARRANWLTLSLVAAAVLFSLVVIGIRSYWSLNRVKTTLVARATPPAPPIAVLNLRLSPGVMKGSAGSATELTIPVGDRVALTLELPGRQAMDSYRVRISTIGANGDFLLVWRSGVVRSQSRADGSQVTVEPDSSIFHPSDYLVRVTAPGGDILETYQFRVNPEVH